MQLESFLENSAAKSPDKTALVCEEARLTYREVDAWSNRLAHALIAAGGERGDRVAVYLENSVETVISIFAVLKASAVFLVVNPTTKPDKLAFVLNDCRARALVTDCDKLGSVRQVFPLMPHLKDIWIVGNGAAREEAGEKIVRPFHEASSFPATVPRKRNIDIDLAALIYTSGSTGRPKGVMVTHLNMISAATSITTYLENTPDDIILSLLPLSFDYGLYQVLMAFKCGATVILHRTFTYPYTVVEALIREKVTGLPVVPTILAILLQLDLGKYSFPHLRYVTNTAAALPTPHIRKLRALWSGVTIYSMYGLTECKRVSYLPPDQIDIRPESVGRGMPNEEVYIVDDAGARVGPGVVGELVVRGSNVMKGYWERPEETDQVLRAGPLPNEKVLYSGDLFRMDEEGYLYFVGRKDDIIKTRGEKVSPKEVENVIYGMEGIAEVVVFGVPDPVLGEGVKAAITLKPGAGLTPRDILAHCSAHLEDFMVPKVVDIVDSLPKTSSGKISRKEARAASDEGR